MHEGPKISAKQFVSRWISCPLYPSFYFSRFSDFVSSPPGRSVDRPGAGDIGNGQGTNHLDGLIRFAILSQNIPVFDR